MPGLPHERYFAELDAETARLAAVVRAADPARPVPSCPDWTLADLATHVGQGLRWAATIVERRAAEWVPPAEVADREPPQGPEPMASWLVAGGSRLAAAVRSAGPDAAVWSWAEERTAGFWLRRMAHEAVIHRLDADLALGRPPSVAAEVAADGVSDLLASIATLSGDHPDPVFADLRGEGQTLHFHATDEGLGAAGEWFVRRTPAGVLWQHGHHRADVAVRGSAVRLLLVLNRRCDPGGMTVHGDAALLTHWLAHSVF